jgi:hypothetical protein
MMKLKTKHCRKKQTGKIPSKEKKETNSGAQQCGQMSSWKNHPKWCPTNILSKLMQNLPKVWNKAARKCGCFWNFSKTVESKRSHNRRKIGQSGHPKFSAQNQIAESHRLAKGDQISWIFVVWVTAYFTHF